MSDIANAFEQLRLFLAAHEDHYDLAVGVEYSSAVDWCCDITPRRNHPHARDYGNVWVAQATAPAEAIVRTIGLARAEIGQPAKEDT